MRTRQSARQRRPGGRGYGDHPAVVRRTVGWRSFRKRFLMNRKSSLYPGVDGTGVEGRGVSEPLAAGTPRSVPLLDALGLVGYRRVAYRPWSMRARAPAFLPTPGPLRSWAPRQHGPTEQAAGLCCMKSGRSLSRPRGETRGPRHRVTQLLTTPQCLLLVPNRESSAVR